MLLRPSSSALSPLAENCRRQLFALLGLTGVHLAAMQSIAAAAGVPELRLCDVRDILMLLTDRPIALSTAAALADALTDTLQRPVALRLCSTIPSDGRAAAWAEAVPLWP